MGKYMRKSKNASDVALLDLSHTQSSLGVRTRAKTLAIQRLERTTEAVAGGSSTVCADCGSYMQLRNRRLQKPPIGPYSRTHKPSQQNSCPSSKPAQNQDQSPRASSRLRQASSSNTSSVNKGGGYFDGLEKEDINLPESNGAVEENDNKGDNFGIEASFGENLHEFEGRERTTRESTPCSFIRDPDAIQTPPGSSTRRRPTDTSQVQSRIQNSLLSHIPPTNEVDEFFSDAEIQQQRQFIEKYNYDPVNDKPLPGRYEWETVNP
ncbi:unnamed protein product [Cuscuta europaea]|uniref:Cyclin-dependent kinase inhibitor domain-containing protein n=1 Tax=Cuscuta europaea TaxID=41803 RepID=A0A9P0ZFQ2_CUSEU|nr:unnamed protein product [Cuscuta europaea]